MSSLFDPKKLIDTLEVTGEMATKIRSSRKAATNADQELHRTEDHPDDSNKNHSRHSKSSA